MIYFHKEYFISLGIKDVSLREMSFPQVIFTSTMKKIEDILCKDVLFPGNI